MTESEAFDYLYDRAAAHGITVDELLSLCPSCVSDCYIESANYVETKHISHILPQSTHPELASDITNMVLEDPEPNMSRGAKPMTETEILTAKLDGEIDAEVFNDNNEYDDIFDVFDFAFA